MDGYSGVPVNSQAAPDLIDLAAPDLIDLVAELREHLGLPSGALPISPKQAWEEAIREVDRLVERDAHPWHVAQGPGEVVIS